MIACRTDRHLHPRIIPRSIFSYSMSLLGHVSQPCICPHLGFLAVAHTPFTFQWCFAPASFLTICLGSNTLGFVVVASVATPWKILTTFLSHAQPFMTSIPQTLMPSSWKHPALSLGPLYLPLFCPTLHISLPISSKTMNAGHWAPLVSSLASYPLCFPEPASPPL